MRDKLLRQPNAGQFRFSLENPIPDFYDIDALRRAMSITGPKLRPCRRRMIDFHTPGHVLWHESGIRVGFSEIKRFNGTCINQDITKMMKAGNRSVFGESSNKLTGKSIKPAYVQRNFIKK